MDTYLLRLTLHHENTTCTFRSDVLDYGLQIEQVTPRFPKMDSTENVL